MVGDKDLKSQTIQGTVRIFKVWLFLLVEWGAIAAFEQRSGIFLLIFYKNHFI